jgi:glycosyltransferase involved in cell wall biosynthesis
MKRLLLFKSELLHYSETFIKEQASACVRWRPVLVGTRRVSGLTLDEFEIRLLQGARDARLGRFATKLCRLLDVAPPGAVRALHREAAQLAHAHFGFEAVAYWPVVRRLGLPLAVTLHGVDIMTHPQWWEQHGGMISRHYPRRLLALGRSPRVHFIAVSQAIARRALAFGLPERRIHVLPIGVDIARFRNAGPPLSQRRPRILCVGRMVEKKGGRYMIEAFARVRAQLPEAELIMVGDGVLLEPLKRLAAERRVPVEFTGRLSSDAVKSLFDSARVFCLPSVTASNGDAEGLCIALLEAQACGVPAVATAPSGATEALLEGTTGFGLRERDVDGMAAALLRLLRDDPLIDSMSNAATQFVAERFDLRRCTRALEDHYDRLAGAAQA